MKQLILLFSMAILLLSNSDCTKNKSTVHYKGKLEITGICMNYTIRVTEGNINPALIVDNWTDETTSKSYDKVFRLGNPCDFPATLKQGDEFYFTIDTAKGKDCAVCMAYYPTPPKALSIKVVTE
jgi:hypothetical protein